MTVHPLADPQHLLELVDRQRSVCWHVRSALEPVRPVTATPVLLHDPAAAHPPATSPLVPHLLCRAAEQFLEQFAEYATTTSTER
jgi:hypothetical protein